MRLPVVRVLLSPILTSSCVPAPPCTARARRAYDEAKQEASGVYGAKVFFYSGLVVNPYESIFAGDVQSAGAPYTGLEWRRKEEVASAQSDEKLGAYFGHLLCG